jgi:tetratricopeptide (TPR) repeat protein
MLRILILTFICFHLSSSLFSNETKGFDSHCFEKLNEKELQTDWAKEYQLGIGFAAQSEYGEAIHSFKRALLLCKEDKSRSKEIEYGIVLTHYLNKDFSAAIHFFESHSLLYVDQNFTAYHDLMIVLFHSYEMTQSYKKSDLILERIAELSEAESREMKLTRAVLRKDFNSVDELSNNSQHKDLIQGLTSSFLKNKKSEKVAKWLNVFVPGLGYYYLGQTKSAVTSFVLNAVLIFGTVQLFLNQYYGLGSLTALLEIGWYSGGVFGAGHSASIYNEALYTSYAEKIFYQESLSPKSKLYYEF